MYGTSIQNVDLTQFEAIEFATRQGHFLDVLPFKTTGDTAGVHMKKLSERRTISEQGRVLADDPWYASDLVIERLTFTSPPAVDFAFSTIPKITVKEFAQQGDSMTSHTKSIHSWCAYGSLDTYRPGDDKPTGIRGKGYLKRPDDNLEIRTADLEAFLTAVGWPLPVALFPDSLDTTAKRLEKEGEDEGYVKLFDDDELKRLRAAGGNRAEQTPVTLREIHKQKADLTELDKAIREREDHIISGRDEPSVNKQATRTTVFPCVPGTKWESIKITLDCR